MNRDQFYGQFMPLLNYGLSLKKYK